jgi:hypothetical protein
VQLQLRVLPALPRPIATLKTAALALKTKASCVALKLRTKPPMPGHRCLNATITVVADDRVHLQLRVLTPPCPTAAFKTAALSLKTKAARAAQKVRTKTTKAAGCVKNAIKAFVKAGVTTVGSPAPITAATAATDAAALPATADAAPETSGALKTKAAATELLAKMQASLRTVMAKKVATPAMIATADAVPAADGSVVVSVGPAAVPKKRNLSSAAHFAVLSKLGANVSRAFSGIFVLERTATTVSA